MRLATLTAASVFALGIGTAHAGWVTTGTVTTTLPTGNDFTTELVTAGVNGLIQEDGSTLSVTSDVTGIELAYVASESGFSNIFNSPSNGISFQETAGGTNNPSNPPDNLFSNPTILAANGTTTIDYEFVSQVGTFGVGTSEFGIFTTTDPNVVFFGLDDNGSGPNGPGPDDNHDDIIIRATTLSQPIDIPEPATLGLLGAGLAGIGFATRRRRRG